MSVRVLSSLEAVLLLVFLCPALAPGQAATEVKMTVQLDKVGWYFDTAGDPRTYGTTTESQSPLPAGTLTPLMRGTIIADVVSINGKPARGTYLADGYRLGATVPGFPRTMVYHFLLDIQTPEGGQIGNLFGTLLGGGSPAPGAPPGGAGLWAVYGGSGAYMGVRGQGTNLGSSFYQTTYKETPAARQTYSTGWQKLEFYVSAINPPEIQAAYHAADGNPVTNSNPARAGEALILQVKAGWPSLPPLEPGQTFAVEPLRPVAFPVEATVNELPAEVINAIGWPGARDRYRVDVRLPAVGPPEATLNLLAGYILATAPYKVPVR